MLTPQEKQQRLTHLLNDLGQATGEYLEKYIDYINKYNAYKLEKAKKYLEIKADKPKATIPQIEAEVRIATHDLRLESDIAEAHYEAHKKKLDAIKTEIDTIRSLLSWDKAELKEIA